MTDHESHNPDYENEQTEQLRVRATEFAEVTAALPRLERDVVREAMGPAEYDAWEAGVEADAARVDDMTDDERDDYFERVTMLPSDAETASREITQALLEWPGGKPTNIDFSNGAGHEMKIVLPSDTNQPDGLAINTLTIKLRDGLLVGDYDKTVYGEGALNSREREQLRELERSLGENGQPLSAEEAEYYLNIAKAYQAKLLDLATYSRDEIRAELGLADL